jgi:vacuolar-type H+-ATPase subunit D/Vma8
LLDRKLNVLRSEQARLRDEDGRAERQWTEAYAVAQLWLRRSAMLGGEREIRMAAASSPATVELSWRGIMGVRCPAVERTVAPDPATSAQCPPGTAALPIAAAAYATALDAAARRAAAAAALAAVSAEVTLTAQRLHAISDRWIPRLEAARDVVARRLDEAERDETIRLRWAAARHGTSREDATP